MSLDAFKNFAVATLAAGINSAATSLSVVAGQGARLPAGSFNATIYNATDYTDAEAAALAGAAEIVRISFATDTGTMVRAQEGTTALNFNAGGKTYKIRAILTAKTFNADIPAAITAAIAATAPGWDSLSGTTPAILFEAGKTKVFQITLSGPTAFSASGYAQGAEVCLFIKGHPTVDYDVSFPYTDEDDRFHFDTLTPFTVPAGKRVKVNLVCESTTQDSVWGEIKKEVVPEVEDGPLSLSYRTGIVAEWVPDNITGSEGDAVSSEPDTGGSSRHAIQATSGKRPLLRLGAVNGRAMLEFDGSNDVLAAAFTVPAHPLTIYLFLEVDSSANQNFVGSVVPGPCAYIDGGNLGLYAGSIQQQTGGSTGQMLVTLKFNGGSSKVWKDGIQVVTGNPGASVFDGGFTLGAYDQDAIEATYAGKLGIVAVFEGDHNNSTMNAIEAQIGAYYAHSVTAR